MPAKKKTVKKATGAKPKKLNGNFSVNALEVMKKRYLLVDEKTGRQETPEEMFRRVARVLAEVEKKYGHDEKFVRKTANKFYEIMVSKEFAPGGRTLTNAGSSTPVIANCVVLPIGDSMEDIFQTLKEAALLQQAGSGLGFDFSGLRPAMTPTKRSRGYASGPVSFLKVYNQAFGIIKQQGRHGANMAMLSVDHPDILDFIRCKRVEGDIRTFNISVKVTDEFMEQVTKNADKQWYCNWRGKKTKPHRVIRDQNDIVVAYEEVDISAKELFDELVHHAWLNGEPGIVFIDEVNRHNPLPGLGPIQCSNPCGEQFLHPYDNCNLGSINLAVFVKNGKIDFDHLEEVTAAAVRMLDNVIDIFNFPVQALNDMARKNRRIGLGVMGFADMLYELGVRYGSKEAVQLAEKTMKAINDASHRTSEELAKEKGLFPNFELSIYAGKKKMRNAALTTAAPTGSISMTFDCSSGIEPNFALAFVKQDKDKQRYYYFNSFFEKALLKARLSKKRIEEIKKEVIEKGSARDIEGLPKKMRDTFVVAMDLSPEEHVKMQAAFQRYIDNSISKTVNFPNSATEAEVAETHVLAWKSKCKSCTVYRDGSRAAQVLIIGEKGKRDPSATPEEKPATLQTEIGLNLPIDQGKIVPRVRPMVMLGKTYKVKTGYGNLYVTVNNDENGAPFEVFATIGKSGGFFQEQSEGICKLISLGLRSGIKAEEIIKDLKGIRGPMPVMTESGTILSLPDAIGQILEEHVKTNGHLRTEMMTPSLAAPQKVDGKIELKKQLADYGAIPECPECGAPLIIEEGCVSCKSCGYSRCN
jgi:ribonucleoside-diphosphate reductase alpha chain